MRTILVALLAGAALVLAAGCGGSSNNAAATTAAATTTAATTAATDTTSTGTTSTDTTSTDTTSTDTTSSAGAAAAAGLSAGCHKVADLSTQFGKALSAAGANGSQPDLQKSADAYKAFAAQVPQEIRGSFQTLADAFAKYAEALKGIDLSSGQTPSAATIAKLAKAAQSLNNKDLAAASATISAWAQKNCHVGG
jgi:hypothetical protein